MSGVQAESDLVVFLIILGVEAVQDSPTKREDGPAPGQTISPVELMVDSQVDALNELDGVEYQAAGLEDNWKRHSNDNFSLTLAVLLLSLVLISKC